MTRRGLRRWHRIHSWTSLICTLFLLLLCVTGLPLVFSDELLEASLPAAGVTAPGAPAPTLASLVTRATEAHPGTAPFSVFVDDDAPRAVVYLKAGGDAGTGPIMPVAFDTANGHEIVIPPVQQVLAAVGELHETLFLGLLGTLLLGAMGLCFVAAIVSGIVLYAPFARGRPFGDVRTVQSNRLRWLDLHNVLGIVLLAWLTVVGVTGVINTLARPLFGVWSLTTAAELKKLDTGDVSASKLAPVDDVQHSVATMLPEKRVQTIVFPSRSYGTPHHFVVWTVGRDHLTSRLFTVALADGETGRLTTIRHLPWYLTALEVSRPLHFGDYGGLPLKILWALFDVGAITVLISGVYLWIAKRRRAAADPISDLLMPDAVGAAR